jgi:hypothetical protein
MTATPQHSTAHETSHATIQQIPVHRLNILVLNIFVTLTSSLYYGSPTDACEFAPSFMDQYSLSQRFQGALWGATIGQQTVGPANTPPIDCQPCLDWLCHQQPPPNLEPNPIASAIALLPLWLYTHESWRERQNRLEQLPDWPAPTTDQSCLWLYGEAIAQLLRPTCRPADLLPNLQTRWQQHAQRGAPAFTPPWHDRLTQIHQWQQQRQPLHEVQAQLAQYPDREQAIATALYCFVRSPDDWPIAQALATRLTDRPTSSPISGLLGGLWGAYNGWTRFPIVCDQRQAIDALPPPASAASQQLMQAWSGRAVTMTTNPLVMGPR